MPKHATSPTQAALTTILISATTATLAFGTVAYKIVGADGSTPMTTQALQEMRETPLPDLCEALTVDNAKKLLSEKRLEPADRNRDLTAERSCRIDSSTSPSDQMPRYVQVSLNRRPPNDPYNVDKWSDTIGDNTNSCTDKTQINVSNVEGTYYTCKATPPDTAALAGWAHIGSYDTYRVEVQRDPNKKYDANTDAIAVSQIFYSITTQLAEKKHAKQQPTTDNNPEMETTPSGTVDETLTAEMGEAEQPASPREQEDVYVYEPKKTEKPDPTKT